MDALAARRTGNGVDHPGRRAAQPVRQRGRRLDRQEFRPQGRVQTAPTVGQHVWPHHMRLGAIPLDRGEPTGIPHGQVGSHPATERCSGAGQLLVPAFQRQYHPCRDGRTSTGRGCRKTVGARAVHGRPQERPRQRLGPLAKGVRVGDEVCHLKARSSARQPRLEVASARHRWLSVSGRKRASADDDPIPRTIPSWGR
jgi:hypothetical protein